MPTADGRPGKTIQELELENEQLKATINRHINRPDVSMDTAILAEILMSIHERLGDLMIWAKERR